MKRLLLIFFLFFFVFYCKAQDSCHLRVSLLTCGAGEDLYTAWGHTAIRVTDSSARTDLVFNYGTFEFGPDFYSKFMRAKLLYTLSIETYEDFLYEYEYDKRPVIEQLLNLTCKERLDLYKGLQVNALPENRAYKYDFLYDNCTTRAGNIIAKYATGPVVFGQVLSHPLTFRNMIHAYMDKGGLYWSRLGIDILLGTHVDKKVTNTEAMFLPDYLLKGFNTAHAANGPLVAEQGTILRGEDRKAGVVIRPYMVFVALLIIVVLLGSLHRKWASVTLSAFDFLLYFVLGLSGLLILFMWFGRDDNVCQNNFNILWTLPTNVVAAFFVSSRKPWVRKYFKAVFWITIAVLFAWPFLPQQMNNELLPVLLIIIYRSYLLSKVRMYGSQRNYLVRKAPVL